MAFDGSAILDIPGLKAGADLSSSQYLAVKLDSNGDVVVCDTAGEPSIGILQNAPVSGQAASVRPLGTSKAVASGSISAGSRVTTDASGKLKAVVAGKTDASGGSSTAPLVGSATLGWIPFAASADGNVVTVILTQPGVPAGTAA